jgi:hypothetical protein
MVEQKPLEWEYRVETLPGNILRGAKDEEIQALLSQWGEEGWDVFHLVFSENTGQLRAIAKRPVTSSQRRKRSMPGLDAFLG